MQNAKTTQNSMHVLFQEGQIGIRQILTMQQGLNIKIKIGIRVFRMEEGFMNHDGIKQNHDDISLKLLPTTKIIQEDLLCVSMKLI